MHAPGIWGIIVVAVVVILLFGRGKISGMMGEVANGIKAFQKGMKDDDKPVEAARLDATARPVDKPMADAVEVDRSKDA
jgi:sec-independent protein translocase protein TatA